MIDALLLGETATAVAKKYHCHVAVVMRLINSPAFKIKAEEQERRILNARSQVIATHVHDIFEQASPGAAGTIVSIASSATDTGTRLDAAKEVLDRAGFVVVKKSVERHVVVNVSEEMLAAVIRAAEGAGQTNETEKEILEYVEGGKDGSKDERGTEVVAETIVPERSVGVGEPAA